MNFYAGNEWRFFHHCDSFVCVNFYYTVFTDHKAQNEKMNAVPAMNELGLFKLVFML